MRKYTDKELKDLPMTQEESNGMLLVIKSELVNNLKFWILMGIMVILVNLVLNTPYWVNNAIQSYLR